MVMVMPRRHQLASRRAWRF